MRALRLIALFGAVMGGCLGLSAAPASATAPAAPIAAAAAGELMAAYAHYRPYWHRHYTPPRVYRPYRSYHPRYHRPRTVCRIQHTRHGVRRVCTRRW